MKQLTAFLSCCILFALTHTVYGQDITGSDSEQAIIWEAFRAENGNNWVVRWDDARNLPRTITNGKTKVYEGTPEEAARSFLSKHHRLFGMQKGLEDLQVHKITENRFGLHRVTFQQYYQGIPVEEALYKIHQFKDGRIGMANGVYYPDIDISPAPSVSSGQALEMAKRKATWNDPSGALTSTKLVVLPRENGAFALAWKTTLASRRPSFS